jgi:hypothetical protein
MEHADTGSRRGKEIFSEVEPGATIVEWPVEIWDLAGTTLFGEALANVSGATCAATFLASIPPP